MTLQGERLLVIAHGHPEIKKGGAEVAAYNLYNAAKESGFFSECIFLATAPMQEHDSTPFANHRQNEVLFQYSNSDLFFFSYSNKQFITREFKSFIQQFKPTVVHFHHYLHIGVEAIKVIKNELPQCKIVMTLHEYLAICYHNGLMIKKQDRSLCYDANPRACSNCFPEIEPSKFLMRKLFIKSFFNLVDAFVCPSKFLKQRYQEWGLESHKMHVIENIIPAKTKANKSCADDRIQLMYMGQINPYKGLDLLLSAISLMTEENQRKLFLTVYGTPFYNQEASFVKKLENQFNSLKHCTAYVGGYEQNQQAQLLSEAHWLVVPSMWWENSPMVIQEAFAQLTPVVCANIGGMAEKVKHLENGIHFEKGNAASLSRVLTEIVQKKYQSEHFSAAIEAHNAAPSLSWQAHEQLYLALSANKLQAV